MSAAVILAGGAARRVGGAMKPAYRIGGRMLVERVLDAVPTPQWWPRIVVGPPELAQFLPADVRLTREVPAGGGPVAAIAAGLALVPAHPAARSQSPNFATPPTGRPTAAPTGHDPADRPGTAQPFRVAIFAADLPFLSTAAVTALSRALDPGAGEPPFDGAVLNDATGRAQWLAGVWNPAALANQLEALGPPAGRAVKDLVSQLRVAFVPVGAQSGPPPWFDCDTEEDLRRAEEWERADTG
jgi:molybdopterin-guanine dinucleotide biosynthesis protein A